LAKYSAFQVIEMQSYSPTFFGVVIMPSYLQYLYLGMPSANSSSLIPSSVPSRCYPEMIRFALT